jgi:hypothetical protein
MRTREIRVTLKGGGPTRVASSKLALFTEEDLADRAETIVAIANLYLLWQHEKIIRRIANEESKNNRNGNSSHGAVE